MKKTVGYILVAVLLLLAGCGQGNKEATGETVTFTDDLGREITVAKNPERVTALLGSFAHMWSLAGGTVVATADDAWDEFAMDLPAETINIGSTKKASLEKVLESEADFILASPSTSINMEWKGTLEATGIPTAYFDIADFEDFLRVLKICTEITGETEAYQKYGEAQKERIEAAIQKSKERIAAEGAPTVLYLRASASSVYVKNSEGSVLGEMLDALGCVNIANSDSTKLENVGLEYILEQDPDYIFIVQLGDNAEGTKQYIESLFRENQAWETLTAVKEGRLIYLDKKLYSLKPNDRWAEAYEKLEEILSDEE